MVGEGGLALSRFLSGLSLGDTVKSELERDIEVLLSGEDGSWKVGRGSGR